MFFRFFSPGPFRERFLLGVFLFAVLAANAGAQNVAMPLAAGSGDSPREIKPLFPAAYFVEYLESRDARDSARPYWVSTETELMGLPSHASQESILLNSDILAFYGHPRSKNMGILGRYTKEELNEKLSSLAAEYRAASRGREIRKAFYIIFGTVWPGGDIGIIQESLLKDYIEYALDNDILVFIDHQIGRFNPVDSLKKMLPWLKYPNVHLALDPEWRTSKPMQEIGSVSAEELNQAQKVMENYITENRIPGERLLVIHQFNWRMISGREKVDTTFTHVRLVHCADGFGAPSIKRTAYAYNAQAVNMPVKGFKLFYNFEIPGAGYDSPLLSPKEVFELNPRPYIVMYQ
jgi:hypothetical protein